MKNFKTLRILITVQCYNYIQKTTQFQNKYITLDFVELFNLTRTGHSLNKSLAIISWSFNPLSPKPSKWSNTLKQLVGNNKQFSAILWVWCLKG